MPPSDSGRRWRRRGWRLAGIACVGLAIVGALLPLMPTTIFLILAAGCFSRSSPRLEAKLLAHPRFGPAIRDWRATRAIPLGGKVMACLGMSLGLAGVAWTTLPRLWPTMASAVLLASCAAYVLRRPTAGRRRIDRAT